jgi:hypothetical protein
MTNSQNSTPDNHPITKNSHQETNPYEDEIDLTYYLGALWKRKYFVLLGAILPALLFYLILFFSPSKYKVTYVYDIGLEEKSYQILLHRFYCIENLDKLTAKLKKAGFEKEISKANVQLEISDKLLAITIVDRSRNDLQTISSIVRDNFEKVIPMYSVKEELGSTIAELKTKMAIIEENKFDLELELESQKTILSKLKNLVPQDTNEIPSGIILQLDEINSQKEYLPFTYQIQANELNIIHINEKIRMNQKKYNYYEDLLSLNKRLLDDLKNHTSSYYSIHEFHSFLNDIVSDYGGKKTINYLNAYIKRIENTISTNAPIIDKSSIHLIRKGAVRKSAIVFTVLLMITIFAVFFFEVVPKKPGQIS